MTGSELQLRGISVAVMMIRHVHGQGWTQRGLVTMCKKFVGCVGIHHHALASHVQRMEADLQEAAPESPAGPAANFHFTRDTFSFKTSCFESRFLLLNMGVSSRTTAPSVHSFGLGWISWFVERVFQRRTSAMWSLWSLLLFEGKWGRWTAWPQGAESQLPSSDS